VIGSAVTRSCKRDPVSLHSESKGGVLYLILRPKPVKQISIALAKWQGVIESGARDKESGSDTDDTLSTASRDNHSCSTGAGGGSSGETGDAAVSRHESKGKEGPFAEERVGEVGGEGEGRGGEERERERRRGREALLDRLVEQLEVMRECCALALMLGRQVVHVSVCARVCARACAFTDTPTLARCTTVR
jgi:hypothetical protein